MQDRISAEEREVIEELKNANELIESNRDTDEHKRISLKIRAAIAKENTPENSEGKK